MQYRSTNPEGKANFGSWLITITYGPSVLNCRVTYINYNISSEYVESCILLYLSLVPTHPWFYVKN